MPSHLLLELPLLKTMKPFSLPRGVLFAFGAAALFGLSTPFSKLLLGHTSPLLLAGLLYLGSGLGLSLLRGVVNLGMGLLLGAHLPGVPVVSGALLAACRKSSYLASHLASSGGIPR